MHARSGLKHWVLVAAGCAAVVGGALGATSATGAVVTSRQAAAVVPEVDLSKVQLPMECGPFPVAVSLKAAAVVDGKALAVLAGHCQADMGTPPDQVFVVEGTGGKPVELLSDRDGYTLTELTIRSDGSIRGAARGYSSDDVPRFSPDVVVELVWKQSARGWTRTETRTPAHTA
ncbi:hypothetical protein [Kitasatospora griseola]|uniref:hypothetical protein n=1 Tax=Kitasatospora griseola TaxID=2064 RepID=UPI00381634F5